MTVTEIRQILESPYNRKVWKNFLQTQFTNNKLNAEDRRISLSDNTISKECVSLGFYEIDEYTKIGIFEIELSPKVNLARNRVQLRNLIKDITKQMAGAMVVFVQGEQWRFSYISKRKFLNKDTNTVEDKETAPKRYTYLFGKGEKALTAAQNFDKLIQKQKGNLYDLLSLDDFEDAFSVEKLGKEFFKNYKEIYEDFVEYITGYRFVKKGSKWNETKVHEPHFDFEDIFKGDAKAVRDFFKRMMGRIIFLYFIQKKGWLAVPKNENWDKGNPDYLYQLFKNARYKELFYSDYLVPLFFDTLNNPDSENEKNELRFPYLNGGLFDKSQDFLYDKLALPSTIFDKLFDTFNRYNFTIYEDAPDEHTVAVDPEMLGHIFENLLEDNKDKGAFYTPKEIVHYMCKESLKAYLLAKEDLDAAENTTAQSALENIILQQELSKDEIKYADKYAYKIIDALDHVKICDPAIGSGAFPMGLLQEIFNAQVYLQELKGFTKAKSDAEIKKHIIEESIYGVDIDEGAVDIARLRFWLSLVVDEPQPQPLPNLSFKIVCANTLIPLGKPKGDLGLTNEIADQIETIREEYFTANKEAKKHLEMQFRNLQNKLWTTAKEWANGTDVEIYKKISEFNPFADKSCSWFDPWWMFGVKEGFDIVIGNPPYVFARGNSFTKEEKKFFYENYKLASYQINIYPLFIEKGDKLLKDRGILSYIVPNNWLTLNTNKDLRELILSKSNISIVNFYAKVFENASVDSSIVIYSKSNISNPQIKLFEFEKEFILIKEESTSYFLNKPEFIINIESLKDNTFWSILEKIENKSNYLKDFVLIKTGLKAYQKGKGNPKQSDFEKDNRVFHSKEALNSEYLKYLQGKDVKRYSIDWSGEYLKYGKHLAEPRNNFDLFSAERILVRQIPSKPPYCINACFVQETLLNDINSMNIINFSVSPKYILSILNSKLISFWFVHKFGKLQRGIFPQFKINELEIFPIKNINQLLQTKFSIISNYLMYLYNQSSSNIFPHTDNTRIASHFEDMLNMMVYELYFEEHMKEVDLDVLQFIASKLESLQNLPIEQQIKELYEWYQKPDNAVRQRMMLIDTRSPDILAVINKSV